MKTNRKWTRLLAILLSFSIFFGQIPTSVLAEEPLAQSNEISETANEPPATDTDLADNTTDQTTEASTDSPTETSEEEPEEPGETEAEDEEQAPFEQQETIEGVLITVTADGDVIAEDARLQIRTVNEPKFTAAAEETLEIQAGTTTIIHHTVYEFTGAEIRGVAKVKLEKLKLTDLKNAYPDGEFSVYVLRDKDNDREGAERADRIAASVQPDRDTVSFLITETGRYDLVTVVRLPEETVISDQGSVVSTDEPDENEEPEETVVSTEEPDDTEEAVIPDQPSVIDTEETEQTEAPEEPEKDEEQVPATSTDLTDEEKEERPEAISETIPKKTEEISFSKGAKAAVSLRALAASPVGEEAGADTQSLAAASPVSYRDGDQTKEISEYTVISMTTTVWSVNSSDGEGWYVASGPSAYVANRIEIPQNKVVNLILCDNSTLQAPYGIHIPNGSRLIIWGQDKGNGTARIDAQSNNAGIGGNENDDKNNPPGRLIINGGIVYAIG
ncbi:MAG: hypothetical protein II719_01785, partial [Clostridia bacterium]|nr:hypothetical protein [Clostridia bacterium]